MAEGNQTELASLLNFFRNRLIIEDQYWKSLDKLAKKQAEFFPLMTGTSNLMTTSQQAFKAIVSAHEDMAAAHKTIAERLSREVVQCLAMIKDKHRTKSAQVKSTLKSSNKEYLEYRTQVLPKLQKAYTSKCESLQQAFGNDEENQPSRHKHAVSKNLAKYAKAKKEMDDADEDYRQGIQELERVRQKHAFHTKSAFEESRVMEIERIEQTKEIFQKFGIAEQEMCDRTNAILEQIFPYVECIKPDVDIKLFSASRQSHDYALPPPVYYHNYYVGVTKDLIFGVPLTEHHRLKKRHVPLIVEKCIDFIDHHGLDKEGIYRISGKHTQVQQLRQAFEKSEAISLTDDVSVASVAGLLKTYIKELPEPLFPFPFNERVEYSKNPDSADRLLTLRHKLSTLPDAHLYTLLYLARHLSRVVQHSDVNKMNLSNICLIFTPVIFYDAPDSTGAGFLAERQCDIVLEDLVGNIQDISDSDGLLNTEGLSSRNRSSQPSGLSPARQHSRNLSADAILKSSPRLPERSHSANALLSKEYRLSEPSIDSLSISTRNSQLSFESHNSQFSFSDNAEFSLSTIPEASFEALKTPESPSFLHPLPPSLPPRGSYSPRSSISSSRSWNRESTQGDVSLSESSQDSEPTTAKCSSTSTVAPTHSITPPESLNNLIS
ncbi:RhoGAP-domain-containing protein [Basidiobolus meristosporus CBS 931.73]|uniref:RhoGAP-domain-containing protein n=1 Tax=Basidiobolus meristosporus CBS 931.73 TaxID=1314790 RepID=A0A1Y1YAY4_9FUNG|nr:RhoGAP-domain-containing protein [Basidiobolus meristosporus CBS 931.73]|eukprot:ORX95159.1 RhoGAP-domain-containing protein [Basidiobolus meristosporus CBS 931.73]